MYKPKLFVANKELTSSNYDLSDQEHGALADFTEDTAEYSITPTTLRHREVKELEDTTFREEYAYKESNVIRFGINKFSNSLRTELENYNNELKTRKTSDNISISSNSSKHIEGFINQFIELTPTENAVINQAISYIKKGEKKTVLIDIIPRDLKKGPTAGEIDLGPNFTTHAVLLYKVGSKAELLAIDPNNLTFSAHLKKSNSNASIKDPQQFTITTLYSNNEKHQIYSKPQGAKAGPKVDEFRDCIDIAVKLAFLLNEDPTHYDKIEAVMQSEPIKLLSNKPIIDCMSFGENLIRLKQFSDIAKIKECYASMKQQQEQFAQQNAATKDWYNRQIEQLNKTHTDNLNSLISQNKEAVNKITTSLQNEYTEYLKGTLGEHVEYNE